MISKAPVHLDPMLDVKEFGLLVSKAWQVFSLYPKQLVSIGSKHYSARKLFLCSRTNSQSSSFPFFSLHTYSFELSD
jgi:hypothetical protein